MSETISQQYENGTSAPGQASASLPPMPPHLAPLNTTGTSGSVLPPLGTITSPISAGGTVRRAAPEPNKRALYVGGLDQRVTEDILRQIFETTGHVTNVKIIPDKNLSNPLANDFQTKGYNYGFVEYEDVSAAERAMQTLNGRSIHQNEIRVNWAYQSNNTNKEDTTNHFHIFVGDLSNEVNDEILLKAFSAFGTVSEARVMWDMKTGRSRGYGFVAFRDQNEAEKALSAMDGEWLGSRAIRCNWANQKGQPSVMPTPQGTLSPTQMAPSSRFGQFAPPGQGTLQYNAIVSQTPHWQTTVYVGNLTPYTTQNDLLPFFQMFGYVVETRFQSDRGFAFVKMDTHENAARAICQINGSNVHGRPLKCSWGKDRPTGAGNTEGYNAPRAPTGYPQSPATGYFPQYAGGPNPMSPMSQIPTNQFAQSPPGYGQPYGTQSFGRNHFQGQSASPYGANFQASPYQG